MAEEPGAPQVPEILTEKTPTYRLLRSSCDLFFRLYFRRRVLGAEHVPATGPVVLAVNHQSYLDIPLVAQSLRRHVCFVARDSLARSRALAFILRETGSVLVRRGTADRAALREMAAHLERGDALAIFPEGTRSTDGRVGEFRRGALHVARMAGAPIVPGAIRGTFEALGRSARFPRPCRVSIRYGEPVDPAEPGAQERVERAVLDMVGDGRYHSPPQSR